VADLRKEKKSLEYGKQVPPSATKPKKRLFPFLVPASVVVIAVLLFFILKPFKLEIASKQEAQAKENSLAIMYFENMPDPEDKDRIAQMITALLITGLSESPQYMQVVSSQRLYDILKLLGKEDLKVIDKTIASEVARKAGVKWILTGKVLQTKPNIVLISEISEATTGKIKATQRVSGATGEDLFAVVDKLSPQIATALSLPEQAKKEIDKPVADVTTHSPEAYRYYLEGIDYRNKFYSKEAKESFRKALEYDSTFAMAYYWLTYYTTELEQKKMLAKAVKYSENVSQKEKHYIRSMGASMSENYTQYVEELQKIVKHYPDEKESFLELGDYYLGSRLFEQAICYLNKAIEIDPLYKRAYNSLAYTYTWMGDFEKSIWAINKYISLAPDEPNPYDSRGDIYAWFGKIDQAIESYKKAEEIKPNFSISHLGHMYLFKREFAKAESCYKELASSSEKSQRTTGRTCLALIPLYQGKFEESLTVLDNGIAADKMEQVDIRTITDKNQIKIEIYMEKKDWNRALKETELYLEVYRKADPNFISAERVVYIMFLAESNDFKKAQEVAKVLRKDIEEKDQSRMGLYWWSVGHIELARGNFEASVTNFEKVAKERLNFGAIYWLARAYLEAGRLGEAVAEFEKALSRYDESRVWNAIWAVKAYYLLGLAYEKSGWNKKAIEKYEEFLDIWKEADPGIPEVKEAQERLAALRAKA